jgi:hypothetical protein
VAYNQHQMAEDDDTWRCERVVTARDGIHEMRCVLASNHSGWCMIDSPSRAARHREKSQPLAG